MKKEEMSLITKDKLAQALKEEMEKKPFEKIKVSTLLKKCDITRPTFYYHFEDIYNLMEWMFERELIQLLKKSENIITWDEGVYLVLEYVQKNEKVCLCAFYSIGWINLQKIFYKDIRKIMQNFMNPLLDEIPADNKHIEFIGDFYTRALVSCLASWLAKGMKETPDEMIHLIDITMHGNIKCALERSSNSIDKKNKY